jgi:hypothetical protein
VRGKRLFVTFADRHHDDRVACWCAAPPGAQEALVAHHPERFFRPPYVGHRGWLGVYLDVAVDWDEVEELVRDAYLWWRRRASPRRPCGRGRRRMTGGPAHERRCTARAIVVVPYDPAWVDTFERVRARVWPALHDVALAIEHVGSTSVPGLWAKPIVDVDVIVPTRPPSRSRSRASKRSATCIETTPGSRGARPSRRLATIRPCRRITCTCARRGASRSATTSRCATTCVRSPPRRAPTARSSDASLGRTRTTSTPTWRARPTSCSRCCARPGFALEELEAIERVNRAPDRATRRGRERAGHGLRAAADAGVASYGLRIEPSAAMRTGAAARVAQPLSPPRPPARDPRPTGTSADRRAGRGSAP